MAKKKKKAQNPPEGKTLATLYLDCKELALYKTRAAQIGLSLSRYFAHLARRDILGENKDLRLYTSSEEMMERLLE